MKKTDRNPDELLAGFPDGVRDDMIRLDALITSIFTGHTRVLWEGVFWGGSEQEIIGYGDLIQKQSRGRTVEWFMVGLALQKNYISIYVHAAEDGQYVAEKYKDSLGKVKAGKSSISFRNLTDVNIDVLTDVLRIARDQID